MESFKKLENGAVVKSKYGSVYSVVVRPDGVWLDTEDGLINTAELDPREWKRVKAKGKG